VVYSNCLSGNLPNSDDVIGVSSEESSSISRPGEGNTSGVDRFGLEVGVVLGQVSNNSLALQIPNLNSALGGSAEPISSWAENKGVDDVSSVQRVKVLSFVQVPESSSSVFTTGSTERTIGRYSDGVNVASVSNQIGSEFAVGKIPDLNKLIPTSRDDDWVLNVGRESNTANPLCVSLFINGVFALSKSIPQLNSLVSGTRNNLSVISREGNRKDVLSVSNKSSSGGSIVQLPKSESSVPRSRKSELSIRRDNDVLDEVRVSSKRSSWLPIVSLFSGKVPDKHLLIS